MRKSAASIACLAVVGMTVVGFAPVAHAVHPETSSKHVPAKKDKKVGPFAYVFQEYVVVEDFPLTSATTPSSPGQINSLLNETCALSSKNGMSVELQANGRTLAVTSMTQVPVSGVTSSQGSRTEAQYAAGFAKYQGLCQYAAKFPRVKQYPFYKMIFGNFGSNSPTATIPASGLSGVRYTDPEVSNVCIISQGQILKCG